jgi:2-keto-4-pentenoate hydratase
VLGRDLPHEKHTLADLIGAVDYLLPAIEVVDSRIAGWDIRISDTIADNASSGLFVLGSRPVLLREVDVVGCGMVLERKGEPESVGGGAACLGNPLLAACWLADTLARRGDALKAGDIVLTGALGPWCRYAPAMYSPPASRAWGRCLPVLPPHRERQHETHTHQGRHHWLRQYRQ